MALLIIVAAGLPACDEEPDSANGDNGTQSSANDQSKSTDASSNNDASGPGDEAVKKTQVPSDDAFEQVDEGVANDEAVKQAHALSDRFTEQMDEGETGESLLPDARSLAETYPDLWQAHMLLGQIRMSMSELEPALGHLRKALALAPDQVELHLLTATVAVKLDKMDIAEEHCWEAMNIEPEQSRYRLHLAQVLIEKQRYGLARRQLEEALQFDAKNHRAYAMMAGLYAEQFEYRRALQSIQRALQVMEPDRFLTEKDMEHKLSYVLQRAKLLWDRPQPKAAEALSVLQDLPQKQQFKERVMAQIAECWMRLDKPERAAAHYKAALDRDSTRAVAAQGAARWYIEAGDAEAARPMIEQLSHINPQHPALAELRADLRELTSAASAEKG